jgi:hypothetical protein
MLSGLSNKGSYDGMDMQIGWNKQEMHEKFYINQAPLVLLTQIKGAVMG